MISVLVLTFNEEANLPGCLDSVSFSDDVVVFDSHSSDGTVEVATFRGARVITRSFDDYGSQRQAALEMGNFRHPWLLVLDADERVDSVLAEECAAVAMGRDGGHAGFRIRRKDHFIDGNWIPRSTLYPTWHLRFFKVAGASYERRAVHEHPVVQGTIGRLKGHLLHYSFNKGMEEWREKHIRYAKLEAAEALAMTTQAIDWPGILHSDPARRRRALKALSYRVPLRGPARFAYMMAVRLAFLDGWSGIRYSWMISRYESWIQDNRRALRGKHGAA